MKRWGWGLIGSALTVAFNVSATVAPSCDVAGDDLRCIATEIVDQSLHQSGGIQPPARFTTNERSVLGAGKAVSQAASPLHAAPALSSSAPLSSSTQAVGDESYDDGCE